MVYNVLFMLLEGKCSPQSHPVAGSMVNLPEKVSVGELAPPLICHAVAWVRERSPHLHPHRLWQVGELAPRT